MAGPMTLITFLVICVIAFMYRIHKQSRNAPNLVNKNDKSDYNTTATDEINNTNNVAENNRMTTSIVEVSHQTNKMQKNMEIPQWPDTYIWSIEDLNYGNLSQRRFYHYFKEQFLKGIYLDIEGNTNYAFLLMYDLKKAYFNKPTLLKEYYKHLIEICPKVESYTKTIIANAKKEKLIIQLKKISTNLQNTCKWISIGEEIEIGGFSLCRGGFYVGDCFKLPPKVIEKNMYHYDCAYIYGPVINPSLICKKDDVKDEQFCSYQDMTSFQRFSYLQWLSGKSPIEETCVDLIRYYVYGLEIRLFIDKSASKERKQILIQLSELYKDLTSLDRNIYGDYYQLAYTIKQIISAGIVKYYPSSASDFLPMNELMSCNDYIDYIINQELKEKTELSSEDAYSIAKKTLLLQSLPTTLYENYIKEKFFSLFQKKYKKHSIIQRYYAQNTHYITTHNGGNLFSPENVNLEFILPEYPIDTWSVIQPINEITSKLKTDFWLYNNCIEYTNDSAPLALLSLPNYIKLSKDNNIDSLKEYLYSMLDKSEYCLIDINSLLEKMGYIRKDEKSLYLQPIQTITNGLKKLKIRTVPLISIDNKRLNFGEKCIIYKIKGSSQVERTDTYARLELFIKLVVQLTQTDGCNYNDIIYVEKYIDSQNDTSTNARHLKGYFRWLQHKKQSFDKRTKDSIGKLLSKEQCKQIAHILVKLSCNQGDINNKRVNVLTKLLPLLGESANDIHSQIHRMLTDEEEFATVEITTNAKEYVITIPQSKRKQKVVKIDTNRLSKLETQTASAQEMLYKIFDEEEYDTSAKVSDQTPMTAILTRLLTKPEWSKAEIENICKEFNVMRGSILEQINDYSYDKVDDAIIEDEDDIIFVNTDYKDQLI